MTENVIQFPARIRRYRFRDHLTIPPRPWIMRGLILRKQMTAMLATGGVGKSSFGLVIALHLAAGMHFGRYKCVGGAKRVAVFTVEEDPDELDRRLHAIQAAYDLPKDCAGNLIVVSAEDSLIVNINKQGVAKLSKVGECMENLLREADVDVILLDPFIEIWAGNENDNNQVRAAAAAIRDMCRRLDAGCLVMHHVRKGLFAPGDMEATRGASSFAALMRLAFTMQPMTKDEAASFGLEHPRGMVRMDHAKGNYIPAADDAFWMKFDNIELDNGTDEQPLGDHVGVLKTWRPPKPLDGVTNEMIDELLNAIEAGMDDGERYALERRSKTRWVGHVIARLTGWEPARAGRLATTWGKSGLLTERKYYSDAGRRERMGIWVDPTKRPETATMDIK